MSSLKTNVVLNLLNTVTSIVFPIVTFPYAARVLLPGGIGAVNFQLSIINYIVLFVSLGIPMYGVREVARHRDDLRLRNRVAVELLLLSLGLCLPGYLVVWALSVWVPQIHAQAVLFYLLSTTILFTALGVQWFYQAVEDFKFITIRGIVVRVLAALSLFLFVKSPDDLLIYGAITVASTVGNNVINFVHLRHFVSLRSVDWRRLKVMRHLRPAFRIFVLNLIVSIYVNLNAVMLGFMQGDEAVGLYTAGVRLSQVVLSVVTSLSVVMLPRCANLLTLGQMDAFSAVAHKSVRFVLGLSLPFMMGLIVLSRPIIALFCGPDFGGSVAVLCWTAPIVLFVGLSNLIGIQILYPQDKERIVIWSTAGGAVFNVVLNLWLIPLWAATGAAISTLVTEGVVLVIQCWAGRRYLPFRLFDRSYWVYVVAAALMSVVVGWGAYVVSVDWLRILVGVVAGGLVYGGVLLWAKDALMMDILDYVGVGRFVRSRAGREK